MLLGNISIVVWVLLGSSLITVVWVLLGNISFVVWVLLGNILSIVVEVLLGNTLIEIVWMLLGNMLSVVLMSRPKLRTSVTALYLTVLAFVDTLVLYTGLLRYCIAVNILPKCTHKPVVNYSPTETNYHDHEKTSGHQPKTE